MRNIEQFIYKYLVYYPTVLAKGANVPKYLKEYKKSQYFSIEKQKEIQESALVNMLTYAKDNIPYYKDVLKDTDATNGFEALKDIPILDKQIIRDNNNDLINHGIKNVMKKASSGSTGIPIDIIKSISAHTHALSAMWRGYAWADIKIGERRGHFWRLQKGIIIKFLDLVMNRHRYSSDYYNQKLDYPGFEKDLLKFQPSYLYGYSKSLYTFAKYLEDKNTNHIKIKSIISTCDHLTSEMRDTLKRVFNANVYNEYGCGEFGPIAHECKHGSMHMHIENQIIEVLDKDNNPCLPGETGYIVITELHNKAMPLIRYKLGDMIALSKDNKQCKCGVTLPIMEAPQGREVENLKHRDGTTFYGGAFFVTFANECVDNTETGIDAIQLIQTHYDKFIVNVQPNMYYNHDVVYNMAYNAISKLFGEVIDISINTHQELTRTRSGKFMSVICEI